MDTEETCNTETELRRDGDEDNVKIAKTSDEIGPVADPEEEQKGAVKMDSENGNQDNSNTDYDDSDDKEAQSTDTGSESDSETDDDDSGGCFSSESETPEEEDLMFSACNDGDIYYVRRRVREHQTIVHIKDAKGRTPLFYACYGQHKVIVKFLLQNGAKATAKAWCSMTPLHVAFRTLRFTNQIKECSAVVRMLVKAGASFNVRDRHGTTPLDLAFENDIARRDLKKFSIGVNEYFFCIPCSGTPLLAIQFEFFFTVDEYAPLSHCMLPTAREGNVFTGVCLSTIGLMHAGSLQGLVTARSVRILLESFLVKIMLCTPKCLLLVIQLSI